MAQILIAIVAWCSQPGAWVNQLGVIHPYTQEIKECKEHMADCMEGYSWKEKMLFKCFKPSSDKIAADKSVKAPPKGK